MFGPANGESNNLVLEKIYCVLILRIIKHLSHKGGGELPAPQDHPLATLLQITLRKTFIGKFNLCEQSVKKSTILLRVAFRKYRPTVGTSSKFDFAHIWLIDNP